MRPQAGQQGPFRALGPGVAVGHNLFKKRLLCEVDIRRLDRSAKLPMFSHVTLVSKRP